MSEKHKRAFTYLECWIKEKNSALGPFQQGEEMKPILQKEVKNGIVSWINGERPLLEQLRSRESPRLENRPAHRKISQNKTLANHFLIVAKIIIGTADASKSDQE